MSQSGASSAVEMKRSRLRCRTIYENSLEWSIDNVYARCPIMKFNANARHRAACSQHTCVEWIRINKCVWLMRCRIWHYGLNLFFSVFGWCCLPNAATNGCYVLCTTVRYECSRRQCSGFIGKMINGLGMMPLLSSSSFCGTHAKNEVWKSIMKTKTGRIFEILIFCICLL